MILPLSDGWAVALSSLTWATVSATVGWHAAHWPPERLRRTGPLTRIRRWERHGAFWQRHLAVRAWKDRVPEAGALFGGMAKRSVGSRATADLVRFRAETIRAERVHWLIAASSPVHLLWCGPALGAAMLAFGVAFNAPFIVIQRANRGRLDRLLARRAAGARRVAAPPPDRVRQAVS